MDANEFDPTVSSLDGGPQADAAPVEESWVYQSIAGEGRGRRIFEELLSPRGGMAAGAVTMAAVLAVAASALSSKKVQPPPPDPSALQLQEARQNLKSTLLEISVERFKADHGDIPQNLGTFQQLIFAQAADLKYRVSGQIGDPKSPNYRVPEAQVYSTLGAEAARRMAQAASGGVQFHLVATDPKTGKKQVLAIGPQDLAILAVAKDTAAQIAQYAETIPAVRLPEVAEDVVSQISERKAASEILQRALGQDSSYSEARDVYGRILEDLAPASLSWEPEREPQKPAGAKRGGK